MNALERKQLADNYAAMMQMQAWADLEQYLKDEILLSVNRSDSKSAAEITIGEVCEERGLRKGLNKVLQHALFRKEGV